MSDRQPRLYVEAVEREVRARGLSYIRRSCDRRRWGLYYDALLVARHADAPARVLEVDEAGTIAIADTMFLHEVGPL